MTPPPIPARTWAPPAGTPLTAREIQVLELLAEGLSPQQVAAKTFTTIATVRTHLKRINIRLGAVSALHAVALAYQRRLLAVPDEPGLSVQERAAWVAFMAASGAARELRLGAGLTLERVGAMCRVSAGTVHYWESGANRPTGPRMEAYYRLLRRLQAEAGRDGAS